MEIKSEKIVHATRFLEMMTTQFTVKDSQDVREWNWCRRPKSQNAVVIIAKVKDSLVVIKEFRVPLNDYEWGLPAGLIDPGEDVKDCVKRELKRTNKFMEIVNSVENRMIAIQNFMDAEKKTKEAQG